jgi:hypothetical protein
MPESGTYGSVRGVPGNRHPYRDRQQPKALAAAHGRAHCRGGSIDACRTTARWARCRRCAVHAQQSYFENMVGIVSAQVGLVVVIVLGTVLRSV